MFVFTQTNSIPSGNDFNPFYSEISLSRFSKSTFVGTSMKLQDKYDFVDNMLERQAEICLVHYIPGVVMKIAFS